MDTKSFLSRVLASRGNYVLMAVKPVPGQKQGIGWNWGNYDTVDDFVAAMYEVDDTPNLTAYFGVASHQGNTEQQPDGKIKVTRKKTTTTLCGTLCFDVDVGPDKPFQTQRQAVGQLIATLDAIGMPPPMLVSSGYGVHVYWPLTTDITAERWEALSVCLAGALRTHGMDIDWTKIYDRSMVLRPVGSHNKKDPQEWRKVKLLRDSPDFDVLELAKILVPYKGVVQPPKKAAAPKARSAIAEAILGGNDFPPVNLDQVADNCAQVRALLASGGATDAAGNPVLEPLWRASLSLAKFSENPNVNVVRLAGQHPDFDLQANLDKMYQWQGTGPASCDTFEMHCASGCAGCPSKGKISSPAALTRGEAKIEVETEEGESEELQLPRGYFAKNGKIYREFDNIKKDKDASGKAVEVAFIDTELVCPYLIWVVARYADDERGTGMCLVRVKYPVEGVKEFEIPLSVLAAGGVELNKLFGNKQLFIKSDELLKKTRSYLMTYLQDIQAEVDTSYVYTRMGWQDDGSFLFGNELIGGRVHEFKTAGLVKSLKDHIKPAGSREAWKEAFSIFGHPDAEMQGCMALIGAGSLLMQGSTIDSVLCNMFSPESGAGKSVTQAAICSLWGFYPKLFLYPVDTDNSLYKSFGAMNSMAPCIDEITTIEPDRLTELLYNIPQGREKKRMTADAELRNPATWKTPIISSSNKDLYAMLDNVMGAQAQKMRLFQCYLETSPLFAKHGERLISVFHDNYGHAAPELIRATIAKGGPRTVHLDMLERFEGIYGFEFTGPERFIKAAFINAAAIGEILRELGLIEWDYTVNIRRGLAEILANRHGAVSSTMDAFDVLGQYLLEHNAYLVEYMENKSAPTARGTFRIPVPDFAVGRIERAFDNTSNVLPGSRLYLNKVLVKKWLAKNGLDYTKVVKELLASGALLEETTRYSIHKGCDKSTPGQAYCWSLDLHHARLCAALAEHKTGQTIKTAPSLSIVSV